MNCFYIVSFLTLSRKKTYMPTTRLLIKGKVQGVFYRISAKEAAKRIGITGWIKNTTDGNVESLVTGTAGQIQEFIYWCRQGPARAKVTDVISNEEQEELFSYFLVI